MRQRPAPALDQKLFILGVAAAGGGGWSGGSSGQTAHNKNYKTQFDFIAWCIDTQPGRGLLNNSWITQQIKQLPNHRRTVKFGW